MNTLRATGNGETADQLEKHHVPGEGQASMPAPKDIVDKINARKELDRQVKDIKAFAGQYAGAAASLNPQVKNRGLAKAAMLQDAVRNAQGLGVFREGEQGFINTFVGSDPTQIFERFRNGAGYGELEKNNLYQLDQLRQSIGLKTQGVPTATQNQFHERPTIKYIDSVPFVYNSSRDSWIKVKPGKGK
jgi:hypothetical protein